MVYGYLPGLFEKMDFFGMSYYACVGHDPMPITQIDTPHKIEKHKLPHDDMWEYYPQAAYLSGPLLESLSQANHYHRKRGCDESDVLRQRAITDYAKIVHQPFRMA